MLLPISGENLQWVTSCLSLNFSKKACKYFDQGRGTCPFGGKCLYLHAYPDGTIADPEKPRKQLGSEGTVRVRALISPICGGLLLI